MAYVQNPELTYDHSASIREDVLDYVAIMSPVTAPLVYQLGFGRALGQPDFGWEMDFVEGPVTNLDPTGSSAFGGDVARRAAYPSGWEAQFPNFQARTKADNTTCIVERTVDVSASLRVSLQYGVGDEYGYKVDQKFLEVVEQFDYNLHFGVFNNGGTNTASPTSARMTHGVGPWLFWTGNTQSGNVTVATSVIPRSAPTDRTGFSSTWVENTGGPLTRENFHALALEPAYQRGMQIEGSVAFCGAVQKRVISEFAHVYDTATNLERQYLLNHQNVEARDRFINEGVDVFDTNLGTVIFNLDRQLDTAANQFAWVTGESPAETHTLDTDEFMFILDLDYWNIRNLRGIGYTPLAKVGDADKALIVLEGGLECLNPIGGIGITDVAA